MTPRLRALVPRFMKHIQAILIVAACALPAAAQDETPNRAQTDMADPAGDAAPIAEELTVATRSAPPFAFRGPEGEWTGIAIELWAALADELDLSYRLVEADALDDMIDGTATGTYDAAIAALSITPSREERIDFTFPYYSTGLGVAVDPQAGGGWLRVARNAFTWQFAAVLAGLAAILLAAGTAVWIFERRGNNEEFHADPVRGLGDGFWWAAVTMTTVGYGDKSPRTLGGRIVGLIWMFTALIVVASFTASIAASLTVGQLGSRVTGLSDLDEVRVGAVSSSSGAEELATRRIEARGFDSTAAGLSALLEDRLDAFVHDRPLLRWLAQEEFDGAVHVLPDTIGREDYGIALPPGSELREPLNRALLSYTRAPVWGRITARYLGTEAD